MKRSNPLLRGVFSSAIVAAAACAPVRVSAQTAPEYALKAAFLYKFAPFVTWPPQAFADPRAPVTLCIAGDDPFGHALDGAANQRVNGRSVRIKRLDVVSGASGCHILYASGSSRQSTGDILRAVRGAPVLTITDASRSSGPRGVIHFVVHESRVRFQLSEPAAVANRLTISSKLYGLALSVSRG